MKLKKLDMLVREIQRGASEAKRQEAEESMFGSMGLSQRISVYDEIIQKINEIYQTKYELMENSRRI